MIRCCMLLVYYHYADMSYTHRVGQYIKYSRTVPRIIAYSTCVVMFDFWYFHNIKLYRKGTLPRIQ